LSLKLVSMLPQAVAVWRKGQKSQDVSRWKKSLKGQHKTLLDKVLVQLGNVLQGEFSGMDPAKLAELRGSWAICRNHTNLTCS